LTCFLANFSQNDISEIVAEPKSTIEETINNCDMLKRQKINNQRSQENCTTPKKNNGQCKYTILSYHNLLVIVTLNCQFYKIQNYIDVLKLYAHCITDNSKKINYKDILNDLNLSEVKRAGTILDGCKVSFNFNNAF